MTEYKVPFSYKPHGIFVFMTNLAYEKGISMKELETMFLRKMCELNGFKCDHDPSMVSYDKNSHKPYCKKCWYRLEKFEETVHDKQQGRLIKVARHKAVPTFVDDMFSQFVLNESKKFREDLK
jgi:hypothetical protein